MSRNRVCSWALGFVLGGCAAVSASENVREKDAPIRDGVTIEPSIAIDEASMCVFKVRLELQVQNTCPSANQYRWRLFDGEDPGVLNAHGEVRVGLGTRERGVLEELPKQNDDNDVGKLCVFEPENLFAIGTGSAGYALYRNFYPQDAPGAGRVLQQGEVPCDGTNGLITVRTDIR